jgi:hypothetical protein
MRRITNLAYILSFCMLFAPTPSAAKSLLKQLEEIEQEVIVPVEEPEPAHDAHFRSDAVSLLGPTLGSIASAAGDFPVVSTAPGFTFRYNSELGLMERAPGSLGSVLIDRAETVGRRQFDVGLSYAFFDFDELNGTDLDGLTDELGHQDIQGDPAFEEDTITLKFTNFQLQSHVLSMYGTYGLTDRWDVNILLPAVFTRMNAKVNLQINNTTEPPVHFFDRNGTQTEKNLQISDTKDGIGDLLLRTKYRLLDRGDDSVKIAVALGLRIPTGRKSDFQGLGDYALTPSFIVSRQFGKSDVHGFAGVDANVNNSPKSRARYGVGASVNVYDGVNFFADFLASQGLADTKVRTDVPIFNEDGTQQIGTEVKTTAIRTDLFDVNTGLKIAIGDMGVVFLSALLPINEDGLRTSVVPLGGVELNF